MDSLKFETQFYIIIIFAGIINRGDSFRRRRSRSSSLIPPLSPMRMPDPVQSNGPDDSYLVSMIGTAGVGKAALLSQFKSSDCINAYDGGRGKFFNYIIFIYFLTIFKIFPVAKT